MASTSLNLNPSSITRDLAPGMTGADVTALQQALIAAGYSIPDGATGYYGDETKAAVTAWQQAAGVDNSSGPGYFGPKSKAVAFGTGAPPGTSTTGTPAPTSAPGTNAPSIDAQLRAVGLSDATIAQLSPEQKAMFAATGAAIQAQYQAGKTVPNTFTAADLDRILQEAQNDPNIDQYYKNQLRVGGADLTRATAYLTGDWNQFQQENAKKFALDNKNLTEAEAAAGTAYSGFRGTAKQQLADANNGIIESTTRSLSKNLDTLGSSFEKTYGSGALAARGGLSVGGVSYSPYGDVSGTQAQNEAVDVRNRAAELQATEAANQGPTSPAPAPVPQAPAASAPTPTPAPAPTPSPAPAPTPAPAPAPSAPPANVYSGVSIVDYLNSVGKNSSWDARAALAQQYGISGYTGTAAQNTQLLQSLRGF